MAFKVFLNNFLSWLDPHNSPGSQEIAREGPRAAITIGVKDLLRVSARIIALGGDGEHTGCGIARSWCLAKAAAIAEAGVDCWSEMP